MPGHRNLYVVLLALASSVANAGDRSPLKASPDAPISHAPTGTRVRFDAQRKDYVTYEVQGSIIYDPRQDVYLLSWNGIDGKRKVLEYRLPNRLQATVAASVMYDTSTGKYRYIYAVKNSSASKQPLRMLYVEAAAPIEAAKVPDGSWMYLPFTPFLKQKLKIENGAIWSRSRHGRLGLAPGEQAEGFSFESAGSPSLVSCFVSGYRPTLQAREDDLPPEELLAPFDSMYWNLPRGFTVGPKLLKKPPSGQEILAELKKILDIGVRQGWIASPEPARSIENSLTELEKRGPAAELASQLLLKVEHARDQLLPEAYVLLTYNLRMLRDLSSN